MKLRIAKKVIYCRGSYLRRAITFERARDRWTRSMDRLINKQIDKNPLFRLLKQALDTGRAKR